VIALRTGNRPTTPAARPTTAPAPRRPHPAPRRRRPPSPELAIRRLTRLGLPVYCGGTRGHDVALTFDDGPGPYTSLALRILHRASAHASFFLVGRLLAERPSYPRQEAALGDVGDHTWTHPYLPRLSAVDLQTQVARTQAAVATATHRRVRFFRPPYGGRTVAVDRVAQRLGMVEVLWSIDSLDWAGAPWDRIARNVVDNARPGSIILMHENRGQTIRALKFVILAGLRSKGLTPVSLSRLLLVDPPSDARVRGGLTACLRRSRG
jgi:peptidoglycan/xylan/chitin deacetylase (PgdA/CDA1 family)